MSLPGRLFSHITIFEKSDFWPNYPFKGNTEDKKPMEFGDRYLKNTDYITLLGSHLSQSGKISDDLNTDFSSRFRSFIKFNPINVHHYLSSKRSSKRALYQVFFNFLNPSATTYRKILRTSIINWLKSTLGVRQSTPNLIVLRSNGHLARVHTEYACNLLARANERRPIINTNDVKCFTPLHQHTHRDTQKYSPISKSPLLGRWPPIFFRWCSILIHGTYIRQRKNL